MNSIGIRAITVGLPEQIQNIVAGFFTTLDPRTCVETLQSEDQINSVTQEGRPYHVVVCPCSLTVDHISLFKRLYPNVFVIRFGCRRCFLHSDMPPADLYIGSLYTREFLEAHETEILSKLAQ